MRKPMASKGVRGRERYGGGLFDLCVDLPDCGHHLNAQLGRGAGDLVDLTDVEHEVPDERANVRTVLHVRAAREDIVAPELSGHPESRMSKS